MFSLMALMISGNKRESSPNAAVFLVGAVVVDDSVIAVATCTESIS
jgi:hypothetical protein